MKLRLTVEQNNRCGNTAQKEKEEEGDIDYSAMVGSVESLLLLFETLRDPRFYKFDKNFQSLNVSFSLKIENKRVCFRLIPLHTI